MTVGSYWLCACDVCWQTENQAQNHLSCQSTSSSSSFCFLISKPLITGLNITTTYSMGTWSPQYTRCSSVPVPSAEWKSLYGHWGPEGECPWSMNHNVRVLSFRFDTYHANYGGLIHGAVTGWMLRAAGRCVHVRTPQHNYCATYCTYIQLRLAHSYTHTETGLYHPLCLPTRWMAAPPDTSDNPIRAALIW